jgi:uncharacterized integral membrane protein (TIGR00698 family)
MSSPHLGRLLPGLSLALAVTIAAVVLEAAETALFRHAWLDALVLAILCGSVVRTLWKPPAACAPGLAFAAKPLLEIGIVLLGATTAASTVLAAGWPLLVAIVAIVTVSIPLSYALGILAGLEPKLATLIACGNSICGNSAIAAVAPVIGAREDEVAASIGFTAVLGIVAVLVLPVIAYMLGFSDERFGILAGMTVYAVPQVLAATSAAGAAALHFGTVVKLVRVLMLGPVSLALALITGGRTGKLKGRHLVPWFIVGFVALMAVRSFGLIPDTVAAWLGLASHVLTTIAMAALGLAVDLRVIRKAGGPVSMVAAGSLVILGLLSVAAISLIA